MPDSGKPKRGKRPDKPPPRQPKADGGGLRGDGLCPKCGRGNAHPDLGGCGCSWDLKAAQPKPMTPKSLKRDEYVEKVVGWALDADERYWPGLAAEARAAGGLSGVYEGKSARLHRMVRLAYLRGLRDGARYAWEARQPVVPRGEGAAGA